MNISSFGGRWFARIAAVGAALTCFAAVAAPPELPEGYISGVVSSSKGPEAGVWVIAETTETRTPFIKIVVTGDEGRYVLPQLPRATYNVWVRGYGLVDSAKVKGRPGDTAAEPHGRNRADTRRRRQGLSRQLLAVVAASRRRRATFPGTGDRRGNGIPPTIGVAGALDVQHQEGCNFCHQLGNQITRTLGHMDPPGIQDARRMRGCIARSSACAAAHGAARWRSSGHAGRRESAGRLDHAQSRNGEVPPQPPRPQGIERNVVVTLWDWGSPQIVHAR